MKAQGTLWLVMGAWLLGSCRARAPLPPERSALPPLRAAMVTDQAGLGDQSFNDSAWRGLQWAKAQLGAQIKVVQSQEMTDFIPNLRALAEEGYSPIFAVGFLLEDAVRRVAPQFPQQVFAIIDVPVEDLPNVAGVVFREAEGAFLAGALAALMSRTGTIGFVGGMEVPVVQRFEAGYRAGARTARPQVKVLAAYAGRFDDPVKGKELALAQFQAGADIVMQAAGGTGRGVIEAAAQMGEGYFAIGSDSDQDGIAPGRVLCSMMKRVDEAVLRICREVQEGRFQPGRREFGLAEKGVGLSEMKYTRSLIPAPYLDYLHRLEEGIIKGEIRPPTDPRQAQGFQPPEAYRWRQER